MKLAVTDANIFIDLFYTDLINQFFEMKIELYTSVEVISELEDDQQSVLISFESLTILNTQDVSVLEDLASSLSPGLSIADTSVIHHAIALKSGVLTGDNLLRKTLEKQGFEVHGVLWIIDQMVTNSNIKSHDGITKLQSLMNYNKRLPISKCESMIKKWQDFP